MPKRSLSINNINKIKDLRQKGHTLSEIQKITRKGYGTVFKYIKDVYILPEYEDVWKVKRGGSKNKSIKDWSDSLTKAKNIINSINYKEKMIILACLYWGEGNKKELSLINSDPVLVRVFVECLRGLGVKNNELKIGLRLFEDIDSQKSINFWLNNLSLPLSTLVKIDYLVGRKSGKLQYGMCRVRVKKSAKYFKLIISMINLIKQSF